MTRAKRRIIEMTAPGALGNLPRTFSAFEPPAGFERVKYTLGVRGLSNGVVVLELDAQGPWAERPATPTTRGRVIRLNNGAMEIDPGLSSTSTLWLCGDRDAGRMFKAFFAGETTLGIVADWIEDDIGDRVKDVREHWLTQHRLHADPVCHFLTLMRCYRDKRKINAKGVSR